MSSSALQVDKRNNSDSRIQKCSTDLRQALNQSCNENFNEYLFNSTLSGLKYVGDRTITRLERSFFACMFFVVVLLSIYFISNVWMKWTASPIIITLNAQSTSVRDLPFPAVTICDMHQVKKSKVKKYPKNSVEFSVIRSMCRHDFYYYENDTNDTQPATWPLFRRLMLEVSPTCNEMLRSCSYGGVPFDCKEKFSRVLTDDGLCCTFNGLHRKYQIRTAHNHSDDLDGKDYDDEMANEWTPETGFGDEELAKNSESYPRAGVGSGNDLGLTMIAQTDMDDYFCSSTRSDGFKVLLHSPTDLPKMSNYGTAVPNGYESRISIVPTLFEATKAVRKIQRSIRQCMFEDENFLSYYRTYSEKNCESECETDLYMKSCNCVMHYQPRPHPNVTICSYAHARCVKDVDREIQLKRNSTFKCNHCLSGCYAIAYDTTFSTSKMFKRAPFLKKYNVEIKNVALIHTFYGKSTFRSQKRVEFVGFTDFVSNMGALLGLFMGFSVISIVEIFYFISLRPYCNYLRISTKRREKLEKIARLDRRAENLRCRKILPFMMKTTEPTFKASHELTFAVK